MSQNSQSDPDDIQQRFTEHTNRFEVDVSLSARGKWAVFVTCALMGSGSIVALARAGAPWYAYVSAALVPLGIIITICFCECRTRKTPPKPRPPSKDSC